MFYVALSRGFLCFREQRYFTVTDIRFATPFDSFEDADAAGKIGTRVLFRFLNGQVHYSILQPAVRQLEG